MIRYFRFPLHGTAVILVATFTFGFPLTVKAGIGGILLAIVLVSWFSKYCFVRLDAIVNGEDEAPVLSAEMLNPVDEQRPVAQMLIVTAAVVLAGR